MINYAFGHVLINAKLRLKWSSRLLIHPAVVIARDRKFVTITHMPFCTHDRSQHCSVRMRISYLARFLALWLEYREKANSAAQDSKILFLREGY